MSESRCFVATSLALLLMMTPAGCSWAKPESTPQSAEDGIRNKSTSLSSTAPDGGVASKSPGEPTPQAEKTPKELSLARLSTIRTAFVTLIQLKWKLMWSTNALIIKEMRETIDNQWRVLESLFSPEGFEVIGWPVWANRVSDVGGVIQIETRIVYTDTRVVRGFLFHDGRIYGVFADSNNKCRDAISRINTPCSVRVYGRYSGRYELVKEADNENTPIYVLYFTLDGIEQTDTPLSDFMEQR